NHLLGTELSKKDLFRFALEGEKLTSGGRSHGDNVAAALFGGFVIVKNVEEFDVINIDYPENLYCVVIHPHVVLNTSKMRKLLGKDIELVDAVKQWGNVAALVAGLINKDYKVISRSVQDFVAEPKRAACIPLFYEVKEAALNAGAVGCSISGSGPSIFAFTKSKSIAQNVAVEMRKIYKKNKIKNDIIISRINKTGPKILLAR
ncbi:MAG TPA: homoserine kinase, partial [Ignavibacteriaceae bacterium]